MTGSMDTAVLVLSCDKYADAWKPFFSLFRKFWPQCPYPVYLGTNKKKEEFPGVTVVLSGEAKDWSTDTKKILEQIPENYVIVLLEDYFLLGQVDQPWLSECLDYMQKNNAAFMRIASFRKDHEPMYAFEGATCQERFGITRADAPFRLNLQAGIWNKNELISLLKEGESPWEFEVNGSVRSRDSKKSFLGIAESSEKDIISGPIPYLCTAITKGTWMRETLSLCKKENVEVDFSKRPIESSWEYFKRRIYHGFSYPNRKYIDFISGKLKGK
jgi:hypothetical protein